MSKHWTNVKATILNEHVLSLLPYRRSLMGKSMAGKWQHRT